MACIRNVDTPATAARYQMSDSGETIGANSLDATTTDVITTIPCSIFIKVPLYAKGRCKLQRP